MWADRCGDVSGPQLQPHLLPQHLAVHCWSERSCHTPATVSGRSYLHTLLLFSCYCFFIFKKNEPLQSMHELTAVASLTAVQLFQPTHLTLSPKVLMELACFEPLRRLVCGMFLPQCSSHGGVLQPCRSVCSSAEQQCSQALDLFSFSWPFNCHLLPDSQDPMECSLPWCLNYNALKILLCC